MALSSEQIDALSKLLDVALELDPSQREEWIASLTPDEQALAEPLREMLANDDKLAADERFAQLPRMSQPEEVATRGEGVGPYRLRHEIGRGGMGSVWLAERSDGNFKRQVALKLPRLAWGAGLAERMAREREIGALLEHPAIARMYDAGVDERGRPYLAFEYIDGQPIDAWCESQALTLRQRLSLFLQVIKAVAYAHGRLVVHRDLKPSNVLVTRDGQAHLLDFGIAKLLQDATQADANLTQEQGRVLTPHYASPEQIAGEPITVASDVYSLGVLLYELLTGVLPVAPRRETLAAIEEAVLQGDIVLASTRVKDKATARALRGELDAILTKAMQRDPQRRYATADALAQDIQRHLQGETVSAKPDTMGYRLRKALRRHWVAVSVATAFLISVLSASAVALVQAQRAARSAERERVVKEFVADVFRVNSRVNPVNAAMRPASPVSLLEGGARLIQQRFAGQPEMQAELFGVVSGVFSDMGAYKLAADYSTHRIEALNLSHADNIEHARALMALAQAQVDDQQVAEAEPRALRALQLLDPETPLGADARVLLAGIELNLSRPEDSLKRLESVEAWLVAHAGSPSTLQAKTLELRGSHQIRLNQAEQAFATFQRAIDVALAAEGRLSLTAVSVRLIVADRRAVSTRDDLARPAFDAAMSTLHELGGAHEARALMAAAQFAFRRKAAFDHGTNAEALASIETSRQRLAALPFPTPEVFAHRLDFMAGTLRFYWGEIGAGLGLLEASVPRLVAAPHSPAEEGIWNGALAAALTTAGRHDEADPLLRKALESAIQSGWGRHPYSVSAYMGVAKNLRMKGDHKAAAAALADIPKFDAISGEGGVDPDRYGRFADWERAWLLVDQGKHAQAIKLLRAQAPKEEGGFAADLREYHEALGVALCGGGDPLHGLSYLTRALGESAKLDESPHAPWTANLRAEAGLCALAAGQTAMARDLARQAHAAFRAQPDVSPYYKKPSQQLDRMLGIHHVASKG